VGPHGLGTLVLLTNAGLLWAYTASCHSCRHIMGGRLKPLLQAPDSLQGLDRRLELNTRHMQLAWASLFGVALTDLYVWLVSSGVFSDPKFF